MSSIYFFKKLDDSNNQHAFLHNQLDQSNNIESIKTENFQNFQKPTTNSKKKLPNDEFIELLNIGIKRKKALINIESNGKNLIFYKQWSRHSIEFMDFYSNLFKVLKESLIK